jgi:hypothetical protein
MRKKGREDDKRLQCALDSGYQVHLMFEHADFELKPPASMAMRTDFEARIMNADFFLVRAASPFTLQTFSVQIN